VPGHSYCSRKLTETGTVGSVFLALSHTAVEGVHFSLLALLCRKRERSRSRPLWYMVWQRLGARGKRRDFSPEAATRHPLSAALHADVFLPPSVVPAKEPYVSQDSREPSDVGHVESIIQKTQHLTVGIAESRKPMLQKLVEFSLDEFSLKMSCKSDCLESALRTHRFQHRCPRSI